jgi:inorganic triphosphatase YgiF
MNVRREDDRDPMLNRSEIEEVELKLELDARAFGLIDWAAVFDGQPCHIRQRSVYFDTPDRALAKAGLSLRIRDDGERRLQTVKARRASTGVFVRREWEFEVECEALVLDDRSPVLAALHERVEQLVPIFTIENDRALWNLDGIEVALDHARITAGDRSITVCEIEFEAKGCDVAALFVQARKVAALTPVDVGVISKSDRGYNLLDDCLAAAKAPAALLEQSMTTSAAFQIIAQACVRQFRLNVAGIVENADADALHRARVAIRRLRTAITIFRPILAGTGSARSRDGLAWVAGELGKARDIDVLLERVGGAPIATQLAVERKAAYSDASAALVSPRARMLILDLVEWINAGDWLDNLASAGCGNAPIVQFAADALERLRLKLRKRGHRFKHLDDEGRHDVRKVAKKLRYAAEFFAPLFPSGRQQARADRILGMLEKLQDQLGELNDLATAPDLMSRYGLGVHISAPGIAPPGIKSELVAQAAETLKQLFRCKRFWK